MAPARPDIRLVTGADSRQYAADLARLRLEVFREWPYLYDGDLAYEEHYLEVFFEADNHCLVLAEDAGIIVGAATGVPLANEHANFKAPLIEAGFDPATLFYCAESVLLPAYRGAGVGHAFFDAREAHAGEAGFTACVFASVIRPLSHPMRPDWPRDLAPFWRKRGYQPLNGVVATFAWTDIGETLETDKRLQFWHRAL